MPHTRQQIQQDVLKLLRNHGKKAFRPKELAKRLSYHDNRTYGLFRSVLGEMEQRGVIARVKGGKYTFRPRPTRLEGTLSVNPKGFGFVEVSDEKGTRELFVRTRHMGTALDGDRVRVAVAARPRKGREGRLQEAEVLAVVERKRAQTVGTFCPQSPRFAYVQPDDRRLTHDIYVPASQYNGAQEGDKVLVSIDSFDDPHGAPHGRVLTVLGRGDDPNVQVLALALSMDVRSGFPDAAIREAERIEEKIPQAEVDRRLDLRKKRIFTIDPVDAKDFDDAIHIEPLENGNFEVGVHIADVSHYVRPGTAIDAEGYARATSVYLVDRVIPMLPEKLSNKVCSLRPHEDKLTYSCIMEVSPRGSVKSYQIRETIIHSQHRFTYEEAQALIADKAASHAFAKDVRRANHLAEVLTRKRMKSGSIDFDLPEIRVVLDDDGHPIDIIRKPRQQSNRLIEEFMLLANRTVAQHIATKRPAPPFIYRIHDSPHPEKIQQLAQYVRSFGYKMKLHEGTAKANDLNDLLKYVKDTPEAPVIEQAALRAMAKAVYSPENIGHYGLGFRYYSHFTSPIRRYPDLIAHRLLKHYATGGQPVELEPLLAQCDHCSERERAAVEAERESVKLKQVEYIRQHLGETFAGVVSGVTKFGVFVRLDANLVEGMVHVRDMDDDYYEYDERTFALMGTYSGQTYKPGTPVTVVVAAANLEDREVDFVFAS